MIRIRAAPPCGGSGPDGVTEPRDDDLRVDPAFRWVAGPLGDRVVDESRNVMSPGAREMLRV